MPGFLVFKEFGLEFSDAMPEMAQNAIKTALAMMPGAWMMHGIGGEHGVDVDPVAEINKTLDGGGAVGKIGGDIQDTAEGVAAGDPAAVAGGVTSAMSTFWGPYEGWIPVTKVGQSFESDAQSKPRDLVRGADKNNEEVLAKVREMMDARDRQLKETKEGSPPPPSTGGVWKTAMGSHEGGVERIKVEVHLDASFPKLLKAALKPDGDLKGPKIFSSADIHLCTTAAIDTRSLTLNSDSPAAQLIQTLIGFFYFNVVPYLTISMSEVQVAEVSYDLDGDDKGIPTVSVTLEYKEIKWAYHVINGSNMNLYTVDFSYDVRKRDQKGGGLSIGSTLNPFA